ncbi:MAG TPA: hypothetical protein VGP93_06805, partial [Polyangiaceae bacterium]|nr:hypothetical protein [Polyangiaceae bacterium]
MRSRVRMSLALLAGAVGCASAAEEPGTLGGFDEPELQAESVIESSCANATPDVVAAGTIDVVSPQTYGHSDCVKYYIAEVDAMQPAAETDIDWADAV